MEERVRGLWAATAVRTWPQPVHLLSFPASRLPAVAAALASSARPFSGLVLERDECSVAVPRSALPAFEALRPRARAGPFRAITLDLDVDLATSGFLLPAAEALAGAGIPVVPLCGYRKDQRIG